MPVKLSIDRYEIRCRKMFQKALSSIRKCLFISVPEKHRAEFEDLINETNVTRAKPTAFLFIVLEVFLLAASFIAKGNKMLKAPGLYYIVMYFLLLFVMLAFLAVFTGYGHAIPAHRAGIRISGIIFTGFILFWCAGISLLDQTSSGQIMVYIVAVLAVAATPFFKPVVIFCMYLSVQTAFLVMLPYFQHSGRVPFGNIMNSTAFVIISWTISAMRYNSRAKEFVSTKLIQEKNVKLNQVNCELQQVNKKLENLSRIDSLTGIFNRYMFDKTIESEWDRCKCQFQPISLLMIDIDHFKSFNDHYGHQAGDECLKRVADVLSSCAKRASDAVARYGGEEFAVILPYMESENARLVAEEIRSKVEELTLPHAYSDISAYVTISIGVHTVIPTGDLRLPIFIKSTDSALYEAKETRNKVIVA